jgi:DNA-binding XRE family transcriptional regulator
MRAANEQTNRLIEQARASADAAQQSAKAADITAQRLAQIEGARIVPSLEFLPLLGNILYGHHMEGGEIVETIGIHIRLVCANHGKSTAWITQKRLKAEVVFVIQESPDFDAVDVIQEGFEPVAPNASTNKEETVMCIGRETGGRMLLLYGSIKYRDMFSDDREVTFGYRVTVSQQLERINLPAYTKNT